MTDDKTKPDEGESSPASLSEVLRLQAIALARMSERMSTQPSPALLPSPRQGRQEDALPILAGDPSLSEESLPVLNTFKKFLEAERRRARRRVIWVSLAFGMGFMVVLGAVAWMGQRRVKELNLRLDQSRQSTVREIDKVSQSATVAAQSLRQDFINTILLSHSNLSSNLNTQMGGSESEVNRLKEKLSSLEIENIMLSSQVKDLVEMTRELQENYSAWIEKAGEQGPSGEGSGTAVRVASKTNAMPLLIRSTDTGRPVQLRLPMEL